LLRILPMKRCAAAALVGLSVLCAPAPMAAVALVTRVHASHCLTESHHGGTSSPDFGHVESLDEGSASNRQQFEVTSDDERVDALECCGLTCPQALLMPELAIIGPSVSVPARWHRGHVASRMTSRLDRPPNSTFSPADHSALAHIGGPGRLLGLSVSGEMRNADRIHQV
jgi:hypothetical protein